MPKITNLNKEYPKKEKIKHRKKLLNGKQEAKLKKNIQESF